MPQFSDQLGAPFATGRTSKVYDFGPGAVVKVPGPDVPAAWPAQEARHTDAVRALGAPAPSVLDLVQIDGRDAIVFERVDGPSMWEVLRASPDRASELGSELGRIHLAILGAGVPLGVGGLVDRIALNLEQVTHFDDVERSQSFACLASLPRGAALLHGDLHPGNVLMSTRGPVVIDWFDAAVGHPVADVMRSSLLLRPFDRGAERPHTPGGSVEMLTALHGAYLAAMEPIVGVADTSLATWEAVVAASRLAEGAEVDEQPLLAIWRHRPMPATIG
ncbi:MAG: aminoglycoside phosphotransferase family protein [Actinomycetota bacterium]